MLTMTLLVAGCASEKLVDSSLDALCKSIESDIEQISGLAAKDKSNKLVDATVRLFSKIDGACGKAGR